MYYDVKSGKFDAHYEYDVRISIKTGMSAGDVFSEWYEDFSSLGKEVSVCRNIIGLIFLQMKRSNKGLIDDCCRLRLPD